MYTIVGRDDSAGSLEIPHTVDYHECGSPPDLPWPALIHDGQPLDSESPSAMRRVLLTADARTRSDEFPDVQARVIV